MEQDDTREATQDVPPARRAPEVSRRDWRDRFGIPEPVKKVFRKFPLVTYPANELPVRSPSQREEHILWIWTSAEGAAKGSLSFNPTCLKWQAYLTFCRIPFRTQASNNHASPSGSLPFLIPAGAFPMATPQPSPVPSSKLRTWAHEHSSKRDDTLPLRAEAYTALIDHRIRRAWLYALYLEPANFAAVAARLYIAPGSSHALVNAAIAFQLRKAAQEELLKTNAHVCAAELVEDAAEAFAALSTLLKEDEWFFGQVEPGLFDAALFAYTHLLLDEGMGWQRNELGEILKGHANLVRHRQRILSKYFS